VAQRLQACARFPLTPTSTFFVHTFLEDVKTVLYKTKSVDGTKPNTYPKTNPNFNTDSIQLFYAFFEHRPITSHTFVVRPPYSAG